MSEAGIEGQLLVSEEATASGAVTISPTDMDGNAVTLTNDSEQVGIHTNNKKTQSIHMKVRIKGWLLKV